MMDEPRRYDRTFWLSVGIVVFVAVLIAAFAT